MVINDFYFIVEIGQNHQGNIEIAKKMVDAVKTLPISAIKTAKRDIDVCLTDEQKSMLYINPNSFGRTYYEHRKALELSKDDFIELKNYVEDCGLDFISSFTDVNSLDFLVDINTKILKIASQRMADILLLNKTAKTLKPIIISTGMCSIEDVDRAVEIFSKNEKYLLQCTSSYPTVEEDLNLNVIKTYKKRYADVVDGFGFSSHFSGIIPDVVAYMMGSKIIERHFTLDRSWKGTDHSTSLGIDGIRYILKYIDQINKSMGSYEKKVLESEQSFIKKLRG